MTDEQQITGIAIVLLVLAGVCFANAPGERPGFTAPYPIEQRRAAHWNLPRWARGEYPQENEPRKPNRAFGLEW